MLVVLTLANVVYKPQLVLAAASTSCGLYTTFAKVKTTSMDLKSTTAAAIAVESYGAAVARGTAGLGGEAAAPRDERFQLLDGLLAHMFARGIALTPDCLLYTSPSPRD